MWHIVQGLWYFPQNKTKNPLLGVKAGNRVSHILCWKIKYHQQGKNVALLLSCSADNSMSRSVRLSLKLSCVKRLSFVSFFGQLVINFQVGQSLFFLSFAFAIDIVLFRRIANAQLNHAKQEPILSASAICQRGAHLSAGFAYPYINLLLFKAQSNSLSNFMQKNLHAKSVAVSRVLQMYEAYLAFQNEGCAKYCIQMESFRQPSDGINGSQYLRIRSCSQVHPAQD